MKGTAPGDRGLMDIRYIQVVSTISKDLLKAHLEVNKYLRHLGCQQPLRREHIVGVSFQQGNEVPATGFLWAGESCFGILETIIEIEILVHHETGQGVEETRSKLWMGKSHVGQGRVFVPDHIVEMLVEVVNGLCICFLVAHSRKKWQGCFSGKVPYALQ